MNASELLGYRHFFREGEPESKKSYAVKVGKDNIQRLCCLMLTYCKPGHTPSISELLQMWFMYKGKSYTDSVAYNSLDHNYYRLIQMTGHNNYYLLCEESLLNLYIWATENPEIPYNVEHEDGVFMIHLFMLYLLFNDDVRENYDKAEISAKKYAGQVNMRRIFCERFPQNDLVKIDYGKLVYTQTFKLMELLNFLELNPKYQALYQYFLNDFGSLDKEDFFKALGGAVISPLNPNRVGINSLILDQSGEVQRSKAFLDKLAFEPGDVSLGPTDYKFLRDKPLQKLPEEYRVVFDLFLIKKLYNGIIFKLSGYVNDNQALLKGPFFGSIRDDFTEGILLYNTMDAVFKQLQAIKIKGNDFKAAGIKREPDYYSRIDNKVMLLESKDFFMVAEEKLSYDFDKIMGGLQKDGRLKKAVLQSVTNVGRVLLQALKLDGGYDSKQIIVFPVVVVHDSLYNCPSLNYWVNLWFQDELSKIEALPQFQGTDFSNVRNLTLVDIDTLILYQKNFERGELNLFQMIEEYQHYVNFNDVQDVIDNKLIRATLPFSEFANGYAKQKRVRVDIQLISDIYHLSGYID